MTNDRFPTQPVERALHICRPDYYGDMHMILTLDGQIDVARLEQAARLLGQTQPILGCRFVEHWYRPYWQRRHDLEAASFVDFKETDQTDEELRRFIERPIDEGFRVLLLRNDRETFCLKLDHRVGDGQALKECAYLLAEHYYALTQDAGFQPEATLMGDRSSRQVSRLFSLRRRWELFRKATRRRPKKIVRFHFSPETVGDPDTDGGDYLIRSLPAESVAGFTRYAYRSRGTVTQLFAAALIVALFEEQSEHNTGCFPVQITTDLRRFLPGKSTPALCNLIGTARVLVDLRNGITLDDALIAIRDEMRIQRRDGMGLMGSEVILDLPILNQIRCLIPHGLQAWLARRARAGRRQRQKIGSPPYSTILTEIGELNSSRLNFGGLRPTAGYATAGIIRLPLVGLSVTHFNGGITLSLGFGKTEFLERVMNRILSLLPIQADSQPAGEP